MKVALKPNTFELRPTRFGLSLNTCGVCQPSKPSKSWLSLIAGLPSPSRRCSTQPLPMRPTTSDSIPRNWSCSKPSLTRGQRSSGSALGPGGRATPIHKRTSHITIILSDNEED